MFNDLVDAGFDLIVQGHAGAIILHDFPTAEREIQELLLDFQVTSAEIVSGGGGEASMTQRMRRAFFSRDWRKECFDITKTVNGVEHVSTSHEVDHVKRFQNGALALEIEWNNKDPFFDRDLENFNRLHDNKAISVGIIVTRGQSLQDSLEDIILRHGNRYGFNSFAALDQAGMQLTTRQRSTIDAQVATGIPFPQAWARTFFRDKFGEATTHWRKLEARVSRGVGHPCPFIGIGIPASRVIDAHP